MAGVDRTPDESSTDASSVRRPTSAGVTRTARGPRLTYASRPSGSLLRRRQIDHALESKHDTLPSRTTPSVFGTHRGISRSSSRNMLRVKERLIGSRRSRSLIHCELHIDDGRFKMPSEKWDDESWTASVVGAARNPSAWLGAADRCKQASDVLRAHWESEIRELSTMTSQLMRGQEVPTLVPSVGASAVMLGGIAVENCLKGIIVARCPEAIQPDRRRPDKMFNWGRRPHDLEPLARSAGIALSPEDRETLAVLTDFSLWAGRYPIAQSASGMRPTDARPHGRGSFSSATLAQLDVMFLRCRATLLDEDRSRQEDLTRPEVDARRSRRDELLRDLAALNVEDTDGTRAFLDLDAHTSGSPALVLCVQCGAEMSLDDGRPATICRCNTLHHYRRAKIAGREEAVVDHYPE